MLTPPPVKHPRRRRRRLQPRTTQPPPVPVALNLVSAVFDEDEGAKVTLVFNQPVDVSGFSGAAVVVDDPVFTGLLYDGAGGAILLNPTTVAITLNAIGDPSGIAVRLTASALSGIVAVDGGGTWSGVTNLELPFP